MYTWLLFNIHSINFLYAVAGLSVLGCTLVLLYDYFCNWQDFFTRYVSPYVWSVIILTSIGGTLTTLLYSEVFGFIPCSLCWLQRVALYPQTMLSILGYKMKDTTYFPVYGLALSAFGLLVAVYQYIYQALPAEMLESGFVPCLADGSADCSKKVIEVFGFVTFPLLSAIMFSFLIVLYLHVRKANNRQ